MKFTDERPVIGITMGDPAGIGPEITVKALADPGIYKMCRPLVIGDAAVMEQAAAIVQKKEIRIHPVQELSEASYEYGTIDIYDKKLADLKGLELGKVSAAAGEAAFQYVKEVIHLAMEGKVDATVTNALNKEAINLAAIITQAIRRFMRIFTGTKKYTMMLAHENLRVVHVSTMFPSEKLVTA